MSGCPYHPSSSGHDPAPTGRDDLTYNTYLKIPELLQLQVRQSNPPHNDELLFIIIHQAYELWFKLILSEIDVVLNHMGNNDVLRAHHYMKRVGEVMKLLVSQIHILETMAPVDFLEFRDRLMPASGFQSLQFRALEFSAGLKDERYLNYFKDRPEMLGELRSRLEAPDLREAYYSMLRRMGYPIPADAAALERREDEAGREAILDALLPVYQKPGDHLPLYLLTESLIEFDQFLGLWREHHVRVVERVIGFKRGTGGSAGAEYLRSTTHKKCFPLLWEVRTRLEKKG